MAARAITRNIFNFLNPKLSKNSAHTALNYQQVMHYNTVLYTTSRVSCVKFCCCCYGRCAAMVASCKQELVAGWNTDLSSKYNIALRRKTGLLGSTGEELNTYL